MCKNYRAFMTWLLILMVSGISLAQADDPPEMERKCARNGWKQATFNAAGQNRMVLWNAPEGAWTNGAILVLHGGGGAAAHFCSGGMLVKPQIHFAEEALERGFAVFALDATTDVVTDANGKVCGKRFDFSVLNRPNVDLPYIEHIITQLVPASRPPQSNPSIFLTGLSTGGYMTIRAATELNDKITAFAPVSAGDPYGTDTNCDTSLSKRKSAKGILTDRETGAQIIEDNACQSSSYGKESRWANSGSSAKPPVKQFHHRLDGIVDLTCMQKVTTLLEQKGYPVEGAFVIEGRRRKSPLNHLWKDDYNEPLLDFFASEAKRR